MSDERLAAAEDLLREVVYRSRERQASVAALRMPSGPGEGDARPGLCGLGDRAAVDLDLSARGRECFDRTFATDTPTDRWPRIQAALTEWVERQDALDRKRNHFLRDFRGQHGFDRNNYASDVLASFEAGLERIRAEEDSARRRAAEQLLVLGREE